jgi:hypothetical protein
MIIKEKIKVYLLSDIIIDNKFPNFIINDIKKISFYINNDNDINRWTYNIEYFSTDSFSFLVFILVLWFVPG